MSDRATCEQVCAAMTPPEAEREMERSEHKAGDPCAMNIGGFCMARRFPNVRIRDEAVE